MRKNILTKYFSVPGKMGMCRNCDHKNCSNCSMGSVFPEVIHKFASEQLQKISPVNQDFRYIRFRAIGNLCVDGPNANYDGFPYGEFLNSEPGYGYQSFVGKHAFVEHNSDNVEKSIGSLLGAYLNRFDTSKYGREWNDLTSEERIDILNNRTENEDGSIEVLMAVDSKLSPSIARMIDTDSEVGCSMGCNISCSDCSICGNRARTELEYCFVPETLILLEDGTTKKIEEIKVDDKVVTHKGRARKVVKIYEREVDEEILNIEYRKKSYSSLKVTKNHPFLVVKKEKAVCNHWSLTAPNTQYCRQGDIKWCKTYNCHSKEIESEFISAENIYLKDFLVTPKVTEIYSTNISKKLAKLLGIFIAEGSYLRQGTGKLSSLSFCIGHHELNTLGTEIISLCKELFNKECFVEKHLNSETKNVSSYDIRCHSTEVAEKFYSLVGVGAKTKKLSLELMYAPLDIQLELLKGWFSGDGCFSNNVITTSSKDLADQLVFLLARQNFITTVHPVNNQVGFASHIENNLIYRVPISRSFIENKFFEKATFSSHYYSSTSNGEFLQQVSKIETIPYKGRVYNLEVEDDNSYVANGVAVHNCNHVAYSKGSTVLVPANQIRNLLKEGKLRPEWIKWVLKREADQREVLSGKTSRMVTATVFEINYGLSFFELSVVANPAYIRGYKLEKIASMLKQGFQELLPLVKVAEGEEVEVHVDVTNDYFNSSTAKKAKEFGKDFKEWSDLEKVEYLRDGEITKEALTSKQVKKVYVETENTSKLEKFGAEFVSMENPTFKQLTNPEILLKLKFASKEEFLKFGAFEYKGTGLDLTDTHDFEILVSQQGKQPQELVDYMYELAGTDEKKLNEVDDYVKMLQVKYKVVPRKYKVEKKEIKNIEEGEKGMVEKRKVPEGQKEATFVKKALTPDDPKVQKAIQDIKEAAQLAKVEGEITISTKDLGDGAVEITALCQYAEDVETWSQMLERYYRYPFDDGGFDYAVHYRGKLSIVLAEKGGTFGSSVVNKKKAIYDGLPSTAEDIKDEGINIEKTEIKTWKGMSEKGDEMVEKEKKSRPSGVIFLEDAVFAAKVVRDTKKAVQGLKGQVKNTLEVLAGELPPGLKEYMEKKKLEKGEKGPEEKPKEKGFEEKEEKFEKPKEEKPGEKKEEKPEEKFEKKPENVKEVLQNAITDLKEVHEDLEEVEEKLEEKAEKPLASVLKGNKRYGRHLQFAVEEALREAKPVIEDAQEAVEEAEKIITDTIKDLEKVEKPKEKEFGKEREPEKPKEEEEKFKEKDEGGENVTKKVEEVVAGATSIKKASDQLRQMFDKEATSFPPTGARDPGDYGEPPVAKELSTWKGFNQEYEKMKGKEKRTEFDTPEGRVDLLTGVVAKLFVNREKRGDSYWLVTKEGSNFAMKSTFADVAEDNQTDENFKKFCSSFYKLLILKAVSNKGLDDTRREMFGSWVKVKKTAVPFEGREITTVPKGLYDSHEGEKDSGKARPGVETTDAPKVAGDKKYYSEAFGDSGYAGELTKAKVAAIVKENENLKKKVKALEEDRIAEALAKRAVDLARKAAAAGVIPFDAESVTEKAQEYSELDDRGFKAVEDTLNTLPVVNAKALKAYQIPEAENVNSGIVYDATDSVRKERIDGKHPDELKIDNMKDDVESAAKLSKKADIGLTEEEEEVIPPAPEKSRFERPTIVEEEEETTEELTADVKERIRKKASVVPQFSKHTVDLESANRVPDFSGRFTTIENSLKKKGIVYQPKVHYYKK